MKIEYTTHSVKFSDIEVGTVFKFNDDIYMKTKELMPTSYCVVNAVELTDGDLRRFDGFESVVVVDCKLIIES